MRQSQQLSGKFASVIFGCLLLSSCVKDGPADISGLIPLDQPRKVLADKVISCFENDNPEIQYGYIEDLNDGRGYTAGRAGFTSGTGDMVVVVQLYTDSVPSNVLAQYLPELYTLAASSSGSVANLGGLPAAWATAAADPVFCYFQDRVSDSLYYQPAVEHARDIGANYPLTLLCLYDACIQHGDGDDPDGLQAMIDRATKKARGTPAEGVSEAKWLHEFNQVREHTLKHPSNEDTKDEWKESVGRVHALEDLRKDGNFLLDRAQIEVNPYGENHVIQL